MKVEVDVNYCCNETMEAKIVIDVNNKKESILFVCKHCKKSLELDAETIINAGKNKKRDPIMSP